MPFISNTDIERKEMLAAIGVKKFSDLLQNIPAKLRLQKECCLQKPLSEIEISAKVKELAKRNISTSNANSFLGGGIYDHYIPAAVDHVISRPEFHSAYTPYQAEVSQGTLQYIYEYQTLICELTGMEAANAGMYDGASATAEAILMAARKTRKTKALISAALNPLYLEVIKAYTEGIELELQMIPTNNGVTNLKKLETELDDEVAAVVLQTPNFFGNLEDNFAAEKLIHSTKKALFIAVVDPISLAILNAPAEYDADIVVGEGQAMGNSQAYGGPLFGFLATTQKLIRMMPGRIVGATEDVDGKRSFALTLQAREQHIRRAKATSNICSNQALCNLAATVYMCLMGKRGLQEVAEQSTIKAHYLAEKIAEIDGFSLIFPDAAFFKEFVVKTPILPSELIEKAIQKNIFAGIDLKQFGRENEIMIAVTEKKRRKDLDEFVDFLQEVYHG